MCSHTIWHIFTNFLFRNKLNKEEWTKNYVQDLKISKIDANKRYFPMKNEERYPLYFKSVCCIITIHWLISLWISLSNKRNGFFLNTNIFSSKICCWLSDFNLTSIDLQIHYSNGWRVNFSEMLSVQSSTEWNMNLIYQFFNSSSLNYSPEHLFPQICMLFATPIVLKYCLSIFNSGCSRLMETSEQRLFIRQIMFHLFGFHGFKTTKSLTAHSRKLTDEREEIHT